MTVLGNDFIIRKGSSLLPWKKYRDTEPLRRRAVNVEEKHTLEDAVCRSHNEAVLRGLWGIAVQVEHYGKIRMGYP